MKDRGRRDSPPGRSIGERVRRGAYNRSPRGGDMSPKDPKEEKPKPEHPDHPEHPPHPEKKPPPGPPDPPKPPPGRKVG